MYTRLYSSFQKFIDQDEHFTEQQQQQILENFKDPLNKKIFRLSIILLLWSVVGITLDSFIIGGSILDAILRGVSWMNVLPTIIFSIVNFLIKTIFIILYLNYQIPLKQVCLAGVPYLGSASVIEYLVRTKPLYGAGLRHYLGYLRKRYKKRISDFFGIKTSPLDHSVE